VTARPSGEPAPIETRLPDGTRVDLLELAREVCARYAEEFPDEAERYGEAWLPWCRHDNQWLIGWAVDDAHGLTNLDRQVAWLDGVLTARGFPAGRLGRDLELAGDVVAERGLADVAERLRAAARMLRRA